MQNEQRKKPSDAVDNSRPQQNKPSGQQEKENYAEHLARVIADADHSKALLQAHYKALHSAPADSTAPRPTFSGEPEE